MAVTTIDEGFNPSEAQAQVTAGQDEIARTQFEPIEDRLIDKVSSSTEPDVKRAGNITRQQFINSRQTFARDLTRRGLSLTTAQQDSIARRRAITETKGIATTKNLTRRGLDDRNRNLLGSLAGLGKGIASSASSGLNTAANAQSSREATGRSLKQQAQASKVGGASMGVGLGAAAGFGPWGIVAAGVAGWLLG